MIFNLLLFVFIGFQIQKLIQFNFFFRLKYLIYNYKPIIVRRTTENILTKQLANIAILDIIYLIVAIIGLVGNNRYLFFGLLFISFISTILFNKIKNKTFLKFIFISDILLSITLLILIVINIFFYQLNSLDFIYKIF